ncbi:fungal hydrophobin-domain-containing protein [Crepidotus variabilis]|uniref:Hydrophobin n=1 Tax=Crepidotus variabilis TaxID=179855 RepID=A0A9P6JTC3_9AGAR|nr:fungal hydrophobin-domain-containing protein [Crepidotus variabilis]
MFSKLAIFVVATMTVFVSAGNSDGINNSCNTGPIQCCNSIYEANSAEANFVKSILNIAIPIGANVAAQCSPLSVIGVGSGSSCSSQPVCCTGNHFNGLVAVGCSPVNVNV